MVIKKSVFKENSLILIFGALFVFSIVMMIVEKIPETEKITGYATSATTVSNVSIQSYLSIDMSANLSSGILFGTVSSLPATNVNGTHNYDSGPNTPNETSYSLNVSTDSNTAVDFCIRSNDDLYDSTGGNRLAIGNETYANSSTTNFTLPIISNETAISKTAYAKASLDVPKGNSTYFRFWLDVPVATPAAVYNNSIMFKGVSNGSACGA